MDMIYIDFLYRVVVCCHCQCPVVLTGIAVHLRTLYTATDDLADTEIRLCAEAFSPSPLTF